MKQVLGKLSRGSILAYSLILLGIVLVASIGMMSASVTNLKSVSSSDKSINAFQIADSGSQAVVRMLKEAAGNELQDISGVTCDGSDAVVESPANFLGGKYKAIFLDSDGKTLACNDNISAVASVKSVGTYSDTARAVQVAIAAAGDCAAGRTVIVSRSDDSTYDSSNVTDVRNFVQNDKGVIVGGSCTTSSASTAVFDSARVYSSAGVGSVVEVRTGGSAFFTCNASTGSCSTCTSGWELYGICPVH